MTTKRLRKIITGSRVNRNRVDRMVAFGRENHMTNLDTLEYFAMPVFWGYDRDHTPIPWELRCMDEF